MPRAYTISLAAERGTPLDPGRVHIYVTSPDRLDMELVRASVDRKKFCFFSVSHGKAVEAHPQRDSQAIVLPRDLADNFDIRRLCDWIDQQDLESPMKIEATNATSGRFSVVLSFYLAVRALDFDPTHCEGLRSSLLDRIQNEPLEYLDFKLVAEAHLAFDGMFDEELVDRIYRVAAENIVGIGGKWESSEITETHRYARSIESVWQSMVELNPNLSKVQTLESSQS